MNALFAAGVLLGAFLLFLVQPMVAKMVLPRLGGGASVWITSMLFFQALLLAGYGYAHALSVALRPRWQLVVHAAMAALTLLALPIALPSASAPVADAESLWLLQLLGLTVGAPFLLLAATGPLLGRWFHQVGGPAAENPYVLYAASNAGSFLGLLAYPLLVEPWLPLRSGPLSQARTWSAAYVVLVAIVLACGVAMTRAGASQPRVPAAAPSPLAWPQRLLWVLLALVPSSALLGATQYLTADIAPVPLLWVAPLALYLLTFVHAFARRRLVPARVSTPLLAVLSAAVLVLIWQAGKPGLLLLIPLHLLAVLAVGLVCHGRLADERPDPVHLTEYYLWIALGGALGGVLNAIVAPLVLDSFVEYPLALLAAWLLHPRRPGRSTLLHVGDVGTSAALAVGVVLVALHEDPGTTTLHAERTFHGLHRVVEIEPPPIVDQDTGEELELKSYRVLNHGSTRHGAQHPHPTLSLIPTTYYHRTGPLGGIFEALEGDPRAMRVGAIGLGAGTLATYGQPGGTITFFELDPHVVWIARDSRLFTFIPDSPARIDVRVGDGRLQLARMPDASFGLLVVDAFSSDAIPVHLLTREAIALYMRKLQPGGLLALHLTNQYLDLEPVAGALAADAGLAAVVRIDIIDNLDQFLDRKDASTWAVFARSWRDLGLLARWRHLEKPPEAGRYLWTDDRSNIVSVLKIDL